MFQEQLADFLRDGPRSGVTCLAGIDVGPTPATPADPLDAVGLSPMSEHAVLEAARCLGEPVGYLPEQAGALVQNLIPTASGADHQTSTSSRVTLAFHTETAFHPHLPSYLVLLCLRGDPAAATTWCTVDDAVADLDRAVVETLWQPRFRCGTDESFTGGLPTRLGPPRPIMWGDPASPSWTFDADLMVGIDLEADRALAELAAGVERQQRSVVLEAGDLMVIDNALVVHGRSPFPARYDGTDRWLQRAFVVPDLSVIDERDGRILTTAFA